MENPWEKVAMPVRKGLITRHAYAREAGINHNTIKHMMDPNWDCSPKTLRKLQTAYERLEERRGWVLDPSPGQYNDKKLPHQPQPSDLPQKSSAKCTATTGGGDE